MVFRIYFPVEFFWFSSKFKLLSMSKTMLFILPVFNAIYIPKQQLTVPSSSISKLCQTLFFSLRKCGLVDTESGILNKAKQLRKFLPGLWDYSQLSL